VPEQDAPLAPPPAIPPQELVKPKLLIGEGQDEVRFFGALLKQIGLDEIQIEAYEGKNKLPNYLAALVLRPGFNNLVSLGVTQDADNNAQGGFDSVSNALRRIALAAPSTHAAIETGNPQVGIFILPDGHNQGMLEDLCLGSLTSHPSMPCLDDYFKCIERQTGRLPNNLSKARIHAWLSTQDRPDLPLGLAAEKGYINWSDSVFDSFKRFLTTL
jgi:hypothetical protein